MLPYVRVGIEKMFPYDCKQKQDALNRLKEYEERFETEEGTSPFKLPDITEQEVQREFDKMNGVET